jgi:hypothetical protein
MDVKEFGGALIALGDLFHEANKTLNGDVSSVRVVIRPDIDGKCVDFSVEIIQTLIDAAKGLFSGDHVTTAGGIIDWILRISGASALARGSFVGLIQFLKKRDSRAIKGATEFQDADGNTLYRIEYEDGSEPDVLAAPVFKMATNKKIIRALERVTDPLREEEGITELEIYKPDSPPEQKQRITKEQTPYFLTSATIEIPEPDNVPESDTITTTIRVYGPVYDPKAENWRFELDGKPEYIDISDTTIAADAIARGGAFVNDAYRVRLKVTQHTTQTGKIGIDYKVVKVLDFFPAPRQIGFGFGSKP